MTSTLHRQFIDFSAQKLQQYAQEIDVCLSKLNQEQVWARDGNHQNAIGNLVLHLCGNIQQRIAAIEGREHVRLREAEFSAAGGVSISELRGLLRSTVEEAVSQMQGPKAADLERRIQAGELNQSILESIYHMEIHFALHAGQIIYITKMATGATLGFYKPPQAPAGEKPASGN
jgi:hypothetical protein